MFKGGRDVPPSDVLTLKYTFPQAVGLKCGKVIIVPTDLPRYLGKRLMLGNKRINNIYPSAGILDIITLIKT